MLNWTFRNSRMWRRVRTAYGVSGPSRTCNAAQQQHTTHILLQQAGCTSLASRPYPFIKGQYSSKIEATLALMHEHLVYRRLRTRHCSRTHPHHSSPNAAQQQTNGHNSLFCYQCCCIHCYIAVTFNRRVHLSVSPHSSPRAPVQPSAAASLGVCRQ